MKKFWFLSFILLLLSITLLGAPTFVWGGEVGGNTEEIEILNKEIITRKDKIKQLEETISKYNKNIQQKQLEGVSLRNQIGILDNKLAKITVNIELTQEKIKETKLEIEALELSIKDKEAIIAKQKMIITKIIQNLHANDQKNYLEILLTNNSFADFYNQAKYLENIYIDLGRSVKSFRLAKEDLENKRQQADVRRLTFEDLKKQLEDQKIDLNDQSGVKQNLLIQTKSSELHYQTLLTSLKKQYQVIESEVRSYEDQVRKKLEAQDKIEASGDVMMIWPVPSHYITAYFHDSEYPFRNVFEHSAIDIRAAQGTQIKAAASGYVGRAKVCTLASCYSYVLLIHTGNISTVYGHMSKIMVTEDSFVNRGEIIGYSGGTPGTVGAGPFVTGAHLHFEVRKNGIPVDPLGYLVQ
jgi:murein DD-endopeptidase MepM/ murein hydrolase activator NlpD